MHRRALPHALPLLIITTLLTAPVALADSGGASSGGGGLGPAAPGGSSGSSGSSSAPLSSASPANQRLQASGHGITVATQSTGLLRSRLRFSGSVNSPRSGETVLIERRGRQAGGSWTVAAQAPVARDGSFSATWAANLSGRVAVRAVLQRGGGSASRSRAASPPLTITVYRPAIATIYGPGFYGQRTACGVTLRRTTLGVAHRTLPCGTPVSILWHGRTLVVPVIDRGPYANHADWDLTEATATALGMDGTERIGALAQH